MAEDLWKKAAQETQQPQQAPSLPSDPWEAAALEVKSEGAPTTPGVAAPHYTQRPDISFLETLKSGAKRVITPEKVGETNLPSATNVALGGLEMLSAPFAPITNLVSRAAKYASQPFESLPERKPITTQLPVPGGGATYTMTPPHPAQVVGKAVELSELPLSIATGKAVGALAAPVARALPTVAEKVAAATAEGGQRLKNIGKLSNEAQLAAARNQAGRLAELPAKRAAVESRATADVAAEQARLQAAQRQVGEEAARAVGPVPRARARFNNRYERLRKKGEQVMTRPAALNAAARGISKERGLEGLPTTPAERAGSALTMRLTEAEAGQIEEEVGSQVKRMLEQGTQAEHIDYGAIVKSVLGPVTSEDVSATQLIDSIKRLRAAERAAYGAGHKNLGRQFRVMENAALSDLKTADTKLYLRHNAIDKDYFKQKAAEWYTEGVQNSFNDKTGQWDRGKFAKWFSSQTDEIDKDKFLKRMLGNKYEPTKNLAQAMQEASSANIEKVSQQVVRNIGRRAKDELGGIAAKEKNINAIGEKSSAQIREAETKARQTIQEDIDKKVLAITGKPISENVGTFFGTVLLLHGVGSTGLGIFTGNAGLIESGLASTAMGGITIMNHAAAVKLMNNLKGLSLLRRAARAIPGTGEAIATSNAITRLVKEGEPVETKPVPGQDILSQFGIPPPGAPEIRQSTKPAPKAAPAAKPMTAKEKLLKKYGIE
jgi:hypothetical protein